MNYEELVDYFHSDEDSIDVPPPSIIDSYAEESTSEVYNSSKSELNNAHFETPLNNERSNFYEFNNCVLEVDEKEEEKEEENVFDIFSDSECSDISKYSDNSSFTWGNGDKVNISIYFIRNYKFELFCFYLS